MSYFSLFTFHSSLNEYEYEYVYTYSFTYPKPPYQNYKPQ